MSIECTKDGVSFKCTGDIGNGSVTLRSHTNVEKPDQNIEINLSEPVALTFSLKYLMNFCKASGLSSSVKLCLSNEVPLLVEYGLSNNSYLRFYLAPKVRAVTMLFTETLANTVTFRSATKSKRLSSYGRLHEESNGCGVEVSLVRMGIPNMGRRSDISGLHGFNAMCVTLHEQWTGRNVYRVGRGHDRLQRSVIRYGVERERPVRRCDFTFLMTVLR